MKYTPDFSSRFRILKGGKISLVVSALIAGSTMSFAAPTGGTVTTGSATINQSGSVTTINQSTNKASINWNSFSIAPHETVNFVQPSAQSITLNRVIGTSRSLIEGAMNANGQVFLINPNGVLFANGSQINVGGLVASTLNITDENFQAGNYLFEGNSQNSIINMGTITANNGYVAMMGQTVANEGTIVATMGNVQLASGEKITLNLNGNSLVKLTIDQGTMDALVENKGLIRADGGQVYLTTQALNTILDGMVNNTGIIEASSISSEGGKIALLSDVVVNSGSLLATGKNGGGEILVGGDWQGSNADTVYQATATILTEKSIIDASATDNGDGGKIVIWSGLDKMNGITVANGSLKAEGGVNGGDGGAIETSGHNLQVAEGIKVSAQSYNGESGKWLLDPVDIVVCHTGNCGVADATYTIDTTTLNTANYKYRLYSEGNAATSYISDATINAALNVNNTSVDIMTVSTTGGGNGDITVKGDVLILGNNKSTSGSATNYPRRFGLFADRNIIFESGAKITAGTDASTPATTYNQSLGVFLMAGYSSAGYDNTLSGTNGTDGGMLSPTDNHDGYIYMDGATILTNGGRFQAYASRGDATHASVTIKNSTIDTNNLTGGVYYGGNIEIVGNNNMSGTGVLLQDSTISAKNGIVNITGYAYDGSTGDGVTIDHSTIEALKGSISLTAATYNSVASGDSQVGLRIKGDSALSAKTVTLDGTSFNGGADSVGAGKTGVSLEYGSINSARVSSSEVLDTTIKVTDHSKYGVNFGDSSNNTFTIGNAIDNAQITFEVRGGKNSTDSTVMTTTGTAPVAFVGNSTAYPTSGTNKNYLLFKPYYQQGGVMTYIGGSSVPGGAPAHSVLFSSANLATLKSSITGINTFGFYTPNSALDMTVQGFDMSTVPYVFVGSAGTAKSITLASGANIVKSTQLAFINPAGTFTDSGANFSGTGNYFLLSTDLSKYTGTSAVTPLTSDDAFSTYTFDGTNLRIGGSTVPSTQDAFLCTAGTCGTYTTPTSITYTLPTTSTLNTGTAYTLPTPTFSSNPTSYTVKVFSGATDVTAQALAGTLAVGTYTVKVYSVTGAFTIAGAGNTDMTLTVSAANNNGGSTTTTSTVVQNEVNNVITTIVNSTTLSPNVTITTAPESPQTELKNKEVMQVLAQEIMGTAGEFELLSDTSGESVADSVTLEELEKRSKNTKQVSVNNEIRVPVSRDRMVELINGGVKLPNGVSQQFFIVKGN